MELSAVLYKTIPTILTGSYKELKSKLFRNSIEDLIIEKSDFKDIIDQKILFEELPEIEIKPIDSFLKSERVKIIIQQIYVPQLADKSLQDIKTDFCILFSDYFGIDPEKSNDFALNLFDVLFEGSQIIISRAISEGNLSALEAQEEFRYKKIIDKLDPRDKKFVDSNNYFRKNEKFLMQISDLKIDSFESYLTIAKRFIVSHDRYILLIHAPGGYGKSHLLREIAHESNQVDSEIEALVITPGYPEINNALEKEIESSKKYLLIFDDADRYLDEVESLISYVKRGDKDVKVILTTRTSGLRNINKIISKCRCEELCDEVRISQWSVSELIQLLRFITEQEKLDDEEAIVNLHPIPYFIVWYGRQVKGEKTQDFEKIKMKFINEINYEAESSLSEILPVSKIKDFLLDVALIVPFNDNNESALSVISKSAEVTSENVKSALEILKQNEILRVIGDSLRFYPDMKGDLYLSYRLKEIKSYGTLDKLIKKWPSVFAENIFKNLEAARRYEEIKLLQIYFSKFVKTKIGSVETTSGYERKKVLKLVQFIVEVIPEDCLNLIYIYLNTKLPEGYNADDYLNKLSPTTDDYGPLIIRLLNTDYSRNEILELIYEVNNRKVEGTYSNYKPNELIAYSISPLENRPETINETLDVLQSWIDICDESTGELISYSLSRLLSGTHEYSKYCSGIVSWNYKALRNTPEVLNNRDQAICILRKMIQSSSLKFKLLAIKVAKDIGSTHKSIQENDLLLSAKIAEERKQLIVELKTYVSPNTNFRLLERIEDLFLECWALEKNGTEETKYIMRDFPQTPEYIAFKYHLSVEFLIEDFSVIEKMAPEENRWNWFVRNFLHKSMSLKSEDFQPLVDSLNTKYNSENSIVEYLINLDEMLEPGYLHSLIIDCWVRMNQDAFTSIRKNTLLWEKVPERFKSTINFTIVDLDKKFIDEFANEVISSLPYTDIVKLETFLRLLGVHNIDKASLCPWISEITNKGDSDARSVLVEYLYFIFKRKQDFNSIIKVSMLVISKEKKLSEKLTHNLVISTKNAIDEHEDKMDENLLNKFRDQLLIKLEDIPTIDWYAQKLLEFSITDIDDAVKFLNNRILKFKGSRDSGYKIVPYKGIECIENLVNSYEDYEKLLNKLIALSFSDSSPEVKLCIKDLIDNLKSLKNEISGKLYLEEFIEKVVDAENIDKTIFISHYLPFEEDKFDLLIKVANKSAELGKLKDINKLFYHYCILEGGWTSLPGKPSPELLLRKEMFHKMSSKVKQGSLRAIMKDCIKNIETDIERNLKNDMEFLYPKI